MQNANKNENEHQQETITQLKNTKQTVRCHLSLKDSYRSAQIVEGRYSSQFSFLVSWTKMHIHLQTRSASLQRSKSSGTCSSPQFLQWSIHCQRFLSAQSVPTLVLTGTTPLAAMDCCSSVTHAPKWLGFFRLNDSLFSLADLKEECSHHRLLLHCKNAWQRRMVSANQLADDTMEPSVSRMMQWH